MELYFIINNIKYVIKYDEVFKTRIYKKIDNDLVLLTKEELEVLDNIRNIDKSYILEQTATEIVLNNIDFLHIENSKFLLYSLKIINAIDCIIPDNKKDDFYKNLATLQITSEEFKEKTTGEYDLVKNIIKVDESKTSYHDLTHELLHVASTSYDPETGIVLTGLNTLSVNKEPIPGTKINRGITEGITESLTQLLFPNEVSNQIRNSYFDQVKIVNQITNIVGINKIIDVYFGNNSGFELENTLVGLGIDSIKIFILMRNIEENYYNRDLDIEQNLTSSIQNTLLDCLELKINQMIASNDYSFEKINTLLENYETCLITPENCNLRGRNPDNYVGLDLNIERFNEIKNKYKLTQESTNEYKRGFSTSGILGIIALILCIICVILLIVF